MPGQLPAALRTQIVAQAGAVELSQAYAVGMSKDQIRARVDAGRWLCILPRVYATDGWRVGRMMEIWAALLYAGADAVVSHETAAELWQLLDTTPLPGALVHVMVPATRRVAEQRGVRIHRSRHLEVARHPTRLPARTRVEATVLDMADSTRRLDHVVGVVTRACQLGRTTLARLVEALAVRSRFRWRAEVEAMLADVSKGAETPLELAYLRLVERAHGLPEGTRQHHRYAGGGSQWIDVSYEAFALIVELDGRVGHMADGMFRDRQRDNLSTESGARTLRYGWTETLAASCDVAAQVARVLRQCGWQGQLKECANCAPTDRRTAA